MTPCEKMLERIICNFITEDMYQDCYIGSNGVFQELLNRQQQSQGDQS